MGRALIIALVVTCLVMPAAANEPIAAGYTNWDGVEIDLMKVERKGRVLTVKWAVRNDGDSSQQVVFLLTGKTDTYVVDEENGVKYYVLADKEGNSLASEHEWMPNGHGIKDTVEPGRVKRYWAKFPAPPPEVQSVTVLFGSSEPLEGVPITDR